MIGEDRDGKIERIPLGRIRARSFAARSDAGDGIQQLAESIRSHGLLHPIVVRPAGRDFEVVCGQRRFDAVRSLGWGDVPVLVRELDERQALELTVAENARRAPVGDADHAVLLDRLRDLFPGRRIEELEGWLGPRVDPVPTLEPLPVQPDPVESSPPPEVEDTPQPMGEPTEILSPDTRSPEEPSGGILSGDTTMIIPAAGMTLRKSGLITRVRTLINTLSKSGILDQDLLKDVTSDILLRLETQPAADFLDLRYPPRTKRWLSRHTVNVTKLAVYLARALGMTREEMEDVAVCGFLHDIGMSKVKGDIFTKHAALDQEEWEQVKGHPIEGALLLTKEVVLRDVVARVALEHHEKPDGTGYPAGKKREETHLYARLINVVDTYGAMVSPRAYRLPLIPHDAMRIVMDDGAKGMLDWDLVQAFVRAMSIYPVGSYVRLEGGEIARVVRAQPDIPEKPVIAVVADAQRNMLRVPVEIDLAMTEPMPRFEPIPAPS